MGQSAFYSPNNENYLLNFGPQHPAAHGVLRLVLELSGERVIFADPHIGFLHRGTEKLIETKNYLQNLPFFDRLDYVAPLVQEHAYILAVEALENINVPKRALYIRMLFDELSRISNHVLCITTHALDVGALTPFLWLFEEREKILQFFEEASGARMHAAYYRVGGVFRDLSEHAVETIYQFSVNFLSFLEKLEDLLATNPIWQARLQGIGVLSRDGVFKHAFTGPISRGSGVPWDLRKTYPYSYYKTVSFLVPNGKNGDCYARYHVRIIEMYESIKIIKQCLIKLSSEAALDNNRHSRVNISSTNKMRSKFFMEDMIWFFKEWSIGLPVVEGSVYASLEAPKGEMGVFLASDGSTRPYRCRLRTPGFFHLQGLNALCYNTSISDVVANLGSLDIVFGEVDR
jgi:NADH-quinone oxidoreductase subunit D